MSKFPGLFEMCYQPLYDTAKIDRLTVKSSLFQIPQGRNKTSLETNMEKEGMLPHGKSFRIHGISVTPDLSANINDVKKYVDRTWFRLFIGTKDYLVVPLSVVFDTSSYEKTGDFADELLKLLLKRKGNQPVYKLPDKFSLELIPLQTFKVELHTETIDEEFTPFKVKVVLFGYYLREVH